MRILHLSPIYEPAWSEGGIVRGLSLLCRAQAALGADVSVFTTDSAGHGYLDVPVNREINIGGVKVVYFHTETPNGYRFSTSLGTGLRERLHEFDVMNMAAFWNYPGIIAGHEARRQGVPYVISTHGSLERGEFRRKLPKKWAYYKIFEERNLLNAAAVHFVSELERRESEHLGLRVPSFVVPSGIDLGEFDSLPSRLAARSKLGLLESDRVVAYLGRLSPRKALDVLLRAFSNVIRAVPNVVLLLAGRDFGTERQLRELAFDLNIHERVRFLGHVDGSLRAALLAAADTMVLASLDGECFGYGAVEALASGVPVVVSEHVGVGQQIATDNAGMVVPVEPEAISSALCDLLSNPARLQEMGQNGRQLVRENYEIKSVADRMIKSYEDILTHQRHEGLGWRNCSGRCGIN